MSSHPGWPSVMAVGLGLLAAGAGEAGVRHLADRTVAEQGRSRIVAFEVTPPPEDDRTLAVTVDDPRIVATLGDATVGAGERIGYLRIAGLEAGTTSIEIDGAPLEIAVVEPAASGAGERHRPRIRGPVTGAVVWGVVTVGVELREPLRAPLRSVFVELPDGTRLETFTDTRDRPQRRVTFLLDTQGMQPGRLELAPVAVDEEGRGQRGPSVEVLVARPEPEAITAGEAETPYDVERPERFSDGRMHVGRHRKASGGAFFVNSGAQPAVCFPLEVEAPGLYQVMLEAGGTPAQGVLPTVGIVVGNDSVSTTNAVLLERRWHRLAAGVPFRLDAGTHVITPYFANDFFVPDRADRNLYLDRIEIARVADARPADAEDDGGGPGMAATGMEMGMGMGGGAAAGAVVEVVDDPYGSAGVPLRVGFVRPLEGQILPGTFEVDGRCWWAGVERGDPAPVVSLFVNDRVVDKQRSGAPRFWVDATVFEPGANRIELVARLDDGAVASTPVQTLSWPRAAAEGPPAPPRRHRRFSIHDERWDPAIRETFSTEHHPKERRAAAFYAESEYALDLPEEMEGSYHVFAHLRGDHFEGAPVASFRLRRGEAATEIGRIEAPNWWDTRRAGTVELEGGPKQLVVAFENDRFEPGVGDRNLWLQSVILAQRPVEPDRLPPVVEILYPPHEGHVVHLADALVAECSDNASLASAALLVDGVARGVRVDLNLKPGRVVLPILARHWTPGDHEVALQVTDVTGNSTISEAVTVRVAPDPPARPGRYLRAVHLLDRFAYGPDAGELAAILTSGEEAWLAERLDRPAGEPGDLAAMAAPYHYLAGRNDFEVPRRVLAHAMLTPNPVRARFVLWAQNHFSTWIRKAGGVRKWDEHVAFWRIGAGRFDRLLLASAESPAMLAYLDQERSFAGRINENYAREVMELHTVGVGGGYTQADVTNLALLLTGWTAAFEGDGRGGGMEAVRFAYRFDPQLSDGSATRVLGLGFPPAEPAERYDRTRLALELLAAHPSTARHVSRKLAEHYVRSPAPDGLVNDLERVFLETGGDMKAMLTAIAAHPAFWDVASAERVASPLDYAMRICRATGLDQPWQVADFLARSGHGLFDRPSPDGYPDDDEAYADSNAMVQRWRFAAQIGWQLAGLAPDSLRYAGDAPEDLWQQAVVDAIAVGITGRVLGPESNRAALDVLAGGEGNRDERLRVAAPFIAALPEGNLR